MSESLPNHEKFTWSTAMDVFAETPNRVFLVQKGELARIDKRPETKWIPEFGPGLQFPVFRLPLRQAGAGAGSNPLDPPADGKAGMDWRWEHCIVVVDAEGKIIEDWTQWDKLFTRPHDVEISPYDPERNVWIVDAEGHAVYKFSHDGKKLLLTLGTPRVPGEDDTHFNRPTFLAFMDANTMYLADGYDGTRVIKYDMNGKKLLQWGQKGTPPRETRPGYFNSVHGIGVDPTTRRVFVNDRTNGRVQVFDENGKYLDEWNFGPRPPMDIHSFIVTSDRKLWAADGHSQDPGLRPRRALPVFVGQLGRVSRRHVGRARDVQRPGGQFLRGRGEQRPHPEVPAAAGRQPGIPGRQAVEGRVVGSLREEESSPMRTKTRAVSIALTVAVWRGMTGSCRRQDRPKPRQQRFELRGSRWLRRPAHRRTGSARR